MEVQKIDYTEREMSEVPEKTAMDLVYRLCKPHQRFGRAFRYYWSRVKNMSDELAERHTTRELTETKDRLLSSIQNPNVFAIGYEQGNSVGEEQFIPIGTYSLHLLKDHPIGVEISAQYPALVSFPAEPGKLAIAHGVSMLNEHSNVKLLARVFLLIALRATKEQYSHVFFYSSDHRLRGVYRRFGIRFPEDLSLASDHLVGVYDVNETANRMRVQQAVLDSSLSDDV